MKDLDCDKFKNDKIRLKYLQNIENQLNLMSCNDNIENKWKLNKDNISTAVNMWLVESLKSKLDWFGNDYITANEKKNAAIKHTIQAHARNKAHTCR